MVATECPSIPLATAVDYPILAVMLACRRGGRSAKVVLGRVGVIGRPEWSMLYGK